MRSFILKSVLFLIPLVLINSAFLLMGFVYSPKNDFIINTLLSKDFNKGAFVVRFFGTSRVASGISPNAFVQSFEKDPANRNIQCLNIGVSGKQTGYSIIRQQEYMVPTNLAVIEFFPGKNPMPEHNQAVPMTPLSESFNECLLFYGTKFIMVNSLPNYISNLRGRLLFQSVFAHDNGWEEIRYTHNQYALDKIRSKWINMSRDIYDNDSMVAQYQAFSTLVRNFQKQTGCRLVFLAMPVDGELLRIRQERMTLFNPVEFLEKEFPEALVIDSKTNPSLKDIKTAEGSHLDAEAANRFSCELGKIIYAWVR
jgi:hypothetical protein